MLDQIKMWGNWRPLCHVKSCTHIVRCPHDVKPGHLLPVLHHPVQILNVQYVGKEQIHYLILVHSLAIKLLDELAPYLSMYLSIYVFTTLNKLGFFPHDNM